MKLMSHLFAVALLPFLTGCLVFPHGTLVAPTASGRVADHDDLQPITQAKVTRRIERLERSRVVATDERGEFNLKKDNDLRWLPFVCYAANSIQYQITAEGYLPFTTNLLGGGSFGHGQRSHKLGQVLLLKAQ